MSIELLPCPFCGGKAEIERAGDHCRSTVYTCTDCGAFLETGEEWNHGQMWNQRANLDTELLASMKAERDEADRRAGAAERELTHYRDRVDKLEAAFVWMFVIKPAFKDGLATIICTEEQWLEAKAVLAEPTIPKE
jgi:Lar family restriction alleviation protein